MLMIRNYQKLNFIETFGNKGKIYEAVKNNKKYLMYEFSEFGELEVYSFRVLNKIISSHILGLVQQFQQGGYKYIISDYAETDLLKLQIDQPNNVFPLPVALSYFAKLIQAIEQIHSNKLIYRNVRPETIKVKGDNLFFYDFTLSQFCSRRERMFDIIGCHPFLAPQFFSEDGYGFEVDIWAAGVLLFFMLTNQYPFVFKDKSQKTTLQEIKVSVNGGFSLEKRLATCKNPGFLKNNNFLQDFFKKIFEFDYTERIKIKKIKTHKLVASYFPAQIDPDMLQAIGQQGSITESALISKVLNLQRFSMWKYIEQEQLILDFIEKCSQSLMLDCSNYIPQNTIAKAQFAILKVALIKISNLIQICYGIKKPQFTYNQEEFEILKSSSPFKKTLSIIENKKKAFQGLYRSAYLHLGQKSQDDFYAQQIPEDFNLIKTSYRLALAEIFEIAKAVMTKNKGNKSLFRKLTQVMARMVIMHLINRIFQPQDFSKNFTLYFAWNKSFEIKNLDHWIHDEKQVNLKHFIKETTKNYL